MIGVVIILGVCLLLFALITDYNPDAYTRLSVTGSSLILQAKQDREYSLLTFNIGYCGLDASQDLFIDGGGRVYPFDKEEVETNLQSLSAGIAGENPDFLFLQEVDVKSRRSYGVDQRNALSGLLEGRVYSFALNYKVPFVPVPLTSPMGSVESGLLSLSAVGIKESGRYSFEGEEPFPMRLFDPDWCFLVTRIAVEGGGELVLINAQLSAYDEDGTVRASQLAQIKKFIAHEADQGHYVILGGSWNHELPGTNFRDFNALAERPAWCADLPADFTPEGFHWAVDPSAPTCRDNKTPYEKGENFVVATDGFLLSDNVELVAVKTQDLDFQHADHNPVRLTFSLKQAL